MRILSIATSITCLVLIVVLAIAWIVTGRENPLLEVALAAIFLCVQAQAAISTLPWRRDDE